MNDLMSGGLHRAWKDVMITTLDPPKGDRPFALLDVAGGTGDISFRAAKAAGEAALAGQGLTGLVAAAVCLMVLTFVVPVPRRLGRWNSGERRTRRSPEGVSKTRSTMLGSVGAANWERIRSALVAEPATCP